MPEAMFGTFDATTGFFPGGGFFGFNRGFQIGFQVGFRSGCIACSRFGLFGGTGTGFGSGLSTFGVGTTGSVGTTNTGFYTF